jgi:hypothetical protein
LIAALLDVRLLVGAQRIDLVDVLLDPAEVGRRRVPKAPVVGEAPGDVALVDLVIVVVADLGSGQQILDIFQILVVDLPDLQLLQHDVGERDRVGVELEPVLVDDLVAVVELVEEDVDHRHGAAKVDVPGLARRHQRVQVALVADALHEALYLAAALAVGGAVDVGEVTIAEALEPRVQFDLLREVVVQRQRTHDAHDDTLLLRLFDDAAALIEERLRTRVFLERNVLGQDELSHRFPSPPLAIASPDRADRSARYQPDVKT